MKGILAVGGDEGKFEFQFLGSAVGVSICSGVSIIHSSISKSTEEKLTRSYYIPIVTTTKDIRQSPGSMLDDDSVPCLFEVNLFQCVDFVQKGMIPLFSFFFAHSGRKWSSFGV